MAHDSCHNTQDYPFSGQNLGLRATTGNFEAVDSCAENIIVNGWYNEVKDASPADIAKCCGSSSGKTIGHFTVMVADRAIQVGCAVAQYTNGQWKTCLMACNYAFTNLGGAPVYVSGPAASNCTKGSNVDYPALCKVDEPIKAIP